MEKEILGILKTNYNSDFKKADLSDWNLVDNSGMYFTLKDGSEISVETMEREYDGYMEHGYYVTNVTQGYEGEFIGYFKES